MGFCLSVTGPCRNCRNGKIIVRRSYAGIGSELVPIYRVWCEHERVCKRLPQVNLRPISEEEDEI